MRQGCRDTLEALHTEQTTRKILQNKKCFGLKFPIKHIHIHLKIQLFAWKNMSVVQSTNCATHGDACTLI